MKKADETYTDAEVTAATGLHLDNLRRLITWRAVVPVQAGGGRGRVRLWTARQALRIGVTAQFVEAGYSLQMAHTLTYVLPLDDLFNTIDPAVLFGELAEKSGEGLNWSRARYRLITGDRDFDHWPDQDFYGAETLIVDRRYLYSDVLGDSPTLFAIIDAERQRVYPSYSPLNFVHGAGLVEGYGAKPSVDTARINTKSLLIDKPFLSKDWDAVHRAFEAKKDAAVDRMIIDPRRLVCRTLTVLNLAFGITVCLRRLAGLSVPKHPIEVALE